jgi:hypothetical protein
MTEEIEKKAKPYAEAKANGERYYYTGPCKHGHDAPRLTSSRTCVECHKEKKRKSGAANEQARRDRMSPADRAEYNAKARERWARRMADPAAKAADAARKRATQ